MDYSKKSYVYLICDPGQDMYKIGVTKNLYSKRMKQLQTGNGSELHLVKYYQTFYPFTIEQFMHNKFFKERQHGEWFTLTTEDIHNFQKYCEEYEELIEKLKENPFFAKNLR